MSRLPSAWLLALDFGGTKHTAALLACPARPPSINARRAACRAAGWRAHLREFSPPGVDAACDIETMTRLARELLARERLDSPAAIGVSFGGPVDATAGRVRLSHHVPGWENIPLARLLEDEFGAPVRVDNDANVAALGEYHFGAGQGCRSLLYITASTGVGGGWILDGQPWRGADGMAGEIGHTVADPHGPPCLCGKRGCVERLASGPYMAQDARQRLAEASPQEITPAWGGALLELANGDPQAISGLAISQAAAQGDALALGLLDRSAWALGVGIGNAANLVNPQRFVIGGGVAKAGEVYWERLRQAARQVALPQVLFEVLPAALGDDAPLWGAVALALDCLQVP